MKAFLLISILTIACFFPHTSIAGTTPPSFIKKSASAKFAEKCLEINGILWYDGKKLEDVSVTLMSDGNVIEEYVTKGNKKIKVVLFKDKEYSLVLKKDGFVQAVFEISTDMPNGAVEHNYHVDFEYDMIPQDNTLDKDYIDFPAAYVMYYKKRDEFAVSEKYISHIKKCLGKKS